MKFYIKKKGQFTLEIMNFRPCEDMLFIWVRGFNSAIDKKLITKDDIVKLCMKYDFDRLVIIDYDYAPENTYVMTIINQPGCHQYFIQQNGQTKANTLL